MGAEVQFFAQTDVGRVREVNEDSYLVDRRLKLFIVCDGMGGHAAGEIASSLAVRVMREQLAKNRDLLEDFDTPSGSTTRKDVLSLLEFSVQKACSAVHAEGQRDQSKRGMGTTLSALLMLGSRGFIAHVGDSRIYLIRQGSVHQLTEDHSLINELLKRGRLTKEQIDKVQYKNAVTRAVGVYESVEVDTLDFDVLDGDQFMLCTDGLHGYLQDGEIPTIAADTKDEELSQKLIDLANGRGGKDNITVVVIRVPTADGADVRARDLHLKLEVLHRMPLFRYLTYQELVRVMNITDVRGFGPGQVVMGEGDGGDELYIVLTGRVRVHKGDATITTLGAGEHMGEMALIDSAPRSASVTAEEEANLLVVRRKDFFDLVRKDHSVAVKLLWSFLGVLAQRLRQTSRDLGEARDQLSLEEISSDMLTEFDRAELDRETSVDMKPIRRIGS
ncbi:MAG: Stp1/IreP family PP2C-type Ser/Thr phosphatase [Deltaproteobacteria bacterium]|nr:Stp1/IreP family PP2C-type Ser/Thr phosphatase [Deltaproteobacteria bacterium]